MIKKFIWYILWYILLSTFYSCNASADGLGDVAAGIREPITMITQLVQAISIICGSGLILGSFFKYLEYRKNPVVIRISMVIFMFLFGVALIILGWMPMSIRLTQN